nr:DUF2254 domain-containing protein [Myxococcota bacterium]
MALGIRAVRARWSRLTDTVRSSLWAIPVALVTAAIVAVIGTLLLDRELGFELAELWWPLGAGPEGTRTTLSAIAASVMTVAGVSFSMTIVVLQLASSQYSPRVVRHFRRDRLIQIVFGVFTGTFTYALLAMRTISAAEGEGAPFTAPISVTVAMALGILSMVLLIALVHHVARIAQVSWILHAIDHETRGALDRMYPETLGDEERAAPPHTSPPTRNDTPWIVRSDRDGYIQFVDASAIDTLEGAELVNVEARIGDFVRVGDPLLRVWPGDAGERQHNGGIDDAFVIGRERTMQQDPSYGLRLVVDVALRALSPSLNDPTTAIHCVDTIGALLCRAARRRVPDPMRRTETGLRVHAPRPSLSDMIAGSLEEIVAASKSSPSVLIAVARALTALDERDVSGHHRGARRAIAERIRHVVR